MTEGLVKLVDRAELAANDWSLSPVRYVCIAPPQEDDDFDFEEVLREIHMDLTTLSTEAEALSSAISKNLEGLGA